MRFVHTSDWHLGRLFGGVSLVPEQAFALERLHELLRDAKPELLVLAGDVYDRAVPPPEAVELFDDFLARVTAAGIPVVAIAGNHDSPERLSFGSRLFARAGVHLAGRVDADAAPLVFDDAYGRVHVLPLAYAEPVTVREATGEAALRDHDAALAWRLERAHAKVPEGERSVVVAHGFVAGGIPSDDSERPLSVGGTGQVAAARFAPFTYAALGHLHRPQQVGAPHVRYAGSLYPYSFAESAHENGVTLVTLDAHRVASAEHVALPRLRSLRTIRGTLDELVARGATDPARDDHVLAILEDERALLEPMARLRAVYPNVRDLRRVEKASTRAIGATRGDHRLRATRDLFHDFYREVTEAAPTAAQDAALVELLEAMERRKREAS